MTHPVTPLASTRPFWVWTQGKQPLVAAAIHDGRAVRAEVAEHLALQWSDRRRAEDPFTAHCTTIADTRLVVLRSRFEVDPAYDAFYAELGHVCRQLEQRFERFAIFELAHLQSLPPGLPSALRGCR